MTFVEPAHRRHEPDGPPCLREGGSELGARAEQDGGHARRLRETAVAGVAVRGGVADTMPSMTTGDRHRCEWAGTDPLNIAHHDLEWGVPVRDRARLFEQLTLEGAQAGLAWITVLRKREGYRRLFEGFDPERVAAFTPDDVDRLLADPAIVRMRAKVESTIGNARAIVGLESAGTPFVDHLWSFVGGRPIQNAWRGLGQIPAETAESQAMSKDLKRRGFSFVGPTVLYAFMQAAGLVNDHEPNCFRHAECAALAW